MNSRPLTDGQISDALRAHLPQRAEHDLRDRIMDATELTAQQRAMPSLLGMLTNADPGVRRRSLLVTAALLVGLAIASAVAVGALRLLVRDPVEKLSFEPPANVAVFVAEAYEGLVDLPALSFTVVEHGGPKAHYSYDGAGTIRYDHYGSATAMTPSEFRIFSADQMAERASANGTAVWLVHDGQPNPQRELAFATGLMMGCETTWQYVGLEERIGRPTHHVACGKSEMWLDIETRLPLRSVNAQPGGTGFDVLELEVGPQPPELFVPPPGLVAMSLHEYACVTEGSCASPSPTRRTADRPAITPAPAVGDFAAPTDIDAFVSDVLATYYRTPPAFDVTVRVDGSGGGFIGHRRYLYDGANRLRLEKHGDRDGDPTVLLFLDGELFESYGLNDAGASIWKDWKEYKTDDRDLRLPDLSFSGSCVGLAEHLGFDLVVDRPAHHLRCRSVDFWVDREWMIVVRSEGKPDPLGDDINVEEMVEMRFLQPPAELFVLPEDAVFCEAVCGI